MHRRKLLQLTGATFAAGVGAGCTALGAQENETAQNETANETDGEPPYEPALQFGAQDILIDEGEFSTDVYAVVDVENVGTATSGEVSVTAAWRDADGRYIQEDTAYLPALPPGETWRAYIEGFGLNPEAVEGFDAVGEFEAELPMPPHGMRLTDSEFVADANEIRGVATIEREAPIERVEAQGVIYDADGLILGGSWMSGRTLAAETDWQFSISMPYLPGDTPAPETHDAWLDASAYQIQPAE